MKTIHEIIDRVDVVIGGVKDVPEARRVLKTFRSALKEQFPPTAIICDTKDSVVISRETAYAAERATDWLSHTDGLREKTTALYNRAQHELYNALKESEEMGTEKMDSCIGFGLIGGYPVCAETAEGAKNSIGNSMRPLSLAESHLTRVLSELWAMYEQELDGPTKFTLLCEISRAAQALRDMRGE